MSLKQLGNRLHQEDVSIFDARFNPLNLVIDPNDLPRLVVEVDYYDLDEYRALLVNSGFAPHHVDCIWARARANKDKYEEALWQAYLLRSKILLLRLQELKKVVDETPVGSLKADTLQQPMILIYNQLHAATPVILNRNEDGFESLDTNDVLKKLSHTVEVLTQLYMNPFDEVSKKRLSEVITELQGEKKLVLPILFITLFSSLALPLTYGLLTIATPMSLPFILLGLCAYAYLANNFSTMITDDHYRHLAQNNNRFFISASHHANLKPVVESLESYNQIRVMQPQ